MEGLDKIKLLMLANQYLAITNAKEEQLGYYNGQLLEKIDHYTHSDSVKHEIELQSWIAYFEKYLVDESSVIRKEFFPEKSNFTISIDKQWRAFEFDQIFKSVDFLHKLIAVTRKLHTNEIGFGGERTRGYVYEEARLHYYLAPYEELQVSHIYYASPGDIGFEGNLNTVKETKELVFDIISLEPISRLVKNYWEIKRSKKLNDKEESELLAAIAKAKTQALEEERRRIEIQSQFELMRMDHELAKLERLEKAFDRFLSLSEKIMQMEKRGFGNNRLLEDQLVSSVNFIQTLANNGKISMKELPQ